MTSTAVVPAVVRPKRLIGRGWPRLAEARGSLRHAPARRERPPGRPAGLRLSHPVFYTGAPPVSLRQTTLRTTYLPLTTHHLLWLYLLGAPSVAFIDDTNATHPNVTLVKATVAFGTFRGQVRCGRKPASQPVSKSASPQVSNLLTH